MDMNETFELLEVIKERHSNHPKTLTEPKEDESIRQICDVLQVLSRNRFGIALGGGITRELKFHESGTPGFYDGSIVFDCRIDKFGKEQLFAALKNRTPLLLAPKDTVSEEDGTKAHELIMKHVRQILLGQVDAASETMKELTEYYLKHEGDLTGVQKR